MFGYKFNENLFLNKKKKYKLFMSNHGGLLFIYTKNKYLQKKL